MSLFTMKTTLSLKVMIEMKQEHQTYIFLLCFQDNQAVILSNQSKVLFVSILDTYNASYLIGYHR